MPSPLLRRLFPALLLLLLVGLVAYVVLSREPAPTTEERGTLWPGTGAWAGEQLEALSLEEKVAQLFVVQASGQFVSTDDPAYERLVDRVERFGAGGIIFFQGDPLAQATLTNDLQERARLPLLVAQDMEWGAGMRVEGATTFPPPMAFGATRDPRYAYAAGYVVAQEARALGVHYVLAPVADVTDDPSNPVINVRSYGEAPGLAAPMVGATVRGLQDGGVLATAKHFPGYGRATAGGRLDTLALLPFRTARDAGLMSVMVGHLAVPAIEPDPAVPASLSPGVVRGLLRRELGFRGLVITDALNASGITGRYSPGEAAVRALEAGADLLLMSEDPYAARAGILEAIDRGRLSEARIDASVRRILRAKEWMGLDEERTVDPSTVRERVGIRPHRALSDVVARRALTLPRNEGNLLPLLDVPRPEARDVSSAASPPAEPRHVSALSPPPRRLASFVLASAADTTAGRYFHQQIRQNTRDTLAAALVLPPAAEPLAYEAALQAADSADVAIASAFMPMLSWSGDNDLAEAHRAFLEALLQKDVPVVLVAFGNPYVAEGLVPQPEAYVVAYGNGQAAQRAAAAALFGKSAFRGRLPVTIPATYAYGAGLQRDQVAPWNGPPEAVGLNGRRLSRADSLLLHAIDDRAFPGAAVAVGRAKIVAKFDGYGFFTYNARQPTTPQSLFDLASLTKVVATTTAVMQLYEEGRLALDAPVARYLPAFAQNGKEDVTIRQLLTHSGGLIPYRRFHLMEDVSSREDVIRAIMDEPLQYEPGTRSEYSDLGFITLGLVVEEITGQRLDAYAEAHIFAPLGMDDTGFLPVGHPDTTVVPTEVDRTFRRRLMQGEVHDETAYLLGGVAGHAGLFSTAKDLARFAYMLVNDGRIYGRQFLEPETIRLFTTRAGLPESTRALGWDTRSLEGYSSAGEHFGPESFGHTGFTGTSLWIDPAQDLFVILLTNRVYPTRENQKHIAVRPALADIAYEAIAGPPAPLLPGPGLREERSGGGVEAFTPVRSED